MDDDLSNPNLEFGTFEEKGKDMNDSKPLIAGILLIISGILGLMTWIAALLIDVSMIDLSMLEAQNMTISADQLQSIISICAIIGIISSILPILGGILSLKKKVWIAAILCSISGLITIGPFLISSVLALVSMVLLVMSKEQFDIKENKQEY
jgi:hypothetical protein